MADVTTRQLDGRTITIYRQTQREVPVVLLNSYMEAGEDILHSCQKHDCPAFQLVSVSHIDWDEDMSPWPSDPVVSKDDHFTGQAAEYCAWLEQSVVPTIQESLPKYPYVMIGGYSMSGLFALYAPYVSTLFSRCMCASGSVWFPGFMEYVKETPFDRKPDAVYLSIGNQESKSSNPALQTTEANMRELAKHYSSLGIHSTFELNDGNHYQNAPQRMAKGIMWTLRA